MNELERAIKHGEIQAYYQPQYDALTGCAVSAEALARWVKPDGSVLVPFAFIPEAEMNETIIDLDWCIVRQVCETLSALDEKARMPISVNFSRRHTDEKDFAAKLCSIVDSYGLPHSLIEAEITESVLIQDPEKMRLWAQSVRDCGFNIAADDFGSGFSSFQFIKDMTADVLKIDKSLMSDNCESERERIVLESIFYFAQRLNMVTVAEGVETPEQLRFLITCGCSKIQGYIFAKPMPKSEFIALCNAHKDLEGVDVLQLQSVASMSAMLMSVIFRRYPLVIFANLSRNSFYAMAYEHFTSSDCPSAGVFDELIAHGATTMHPDDRQIFADTFSRDNLLKKHSDGAEEIRLVTRQLGDDGIYRRVETTDYFIKSPSSDDILVICLCDNLEDE